MAATVGRSPTPVLQVCAQDRGSEHVELPMVGAHQVPVTLLLLPSSLPGTPPFYQAVTGTALGLMDFVEGRLSEAGVSSAYGALPVNGRLEGMLGRFSSLLMPLLGCLSHLSGA